MAMDIVIRLGGFHTIMNFLGAIGHLMKGDGLEDVLVVLFGSSTIEHVLSGKPYARAVRGHLLIHTLLTDMLLLYLPDSNLSCDDEYLSPLSLDSDTAAGLAGSVTDSVVAELKQLYTLSLTERIDVRDCQLLKSESVEFIDQQLTGLKKALTQQFCASRLWIHPKHTICRFSPQLFVS